MKKTLIVWGLALGLLAGFSCKKKEPTTSCVSGDKIPAKEFDGFTKAGDLMLEDLISEKLKELYDLGSEEMKNSQTRDQFVFALQMFLTAFGKLDYPQVQEAYYLTSEADEAKDPQVQIACNLGEPGVDDYYGVPANRELGVLVYRARSELELIRIIFQLEKQEGKWFLRSLTLAPETIKHRTYLYYFNQAALFRENNLLHLAALYLKTVVLLSDMGLNVQAFTIRTMQAQLEQIKTDYLPSGEVQIWAAPSGRSYKVWNLDTAYNNGNFFAHVSYLTASLQDQEALKKQAREIAEFLDQKFPEYRLGFDGFRVTAASEKKEEQMKAYHTEIMFTDLPTPANIPVVKPTTKPVKPPPARAGGPQPGAPAEVPTAPRPGPSAAPGPSPAPSFGGTPAPVKEDPTGPAPADGTTPQENPPRP